MDAVLVGLHFKNTHFLFVHFPPTSNFFEDLLSLSNLCSRWSATIPLVFYGFHCDDTLRNEYWTMVSIFGTAVGRPWQKEAFHPCGRLFGINISLPLPGAISSTCPSSNFWQSWIIYHGSGLPRHIQKRMAHAKTTNGNKLGPHNTCSEHSRGNGIRFEGLSSEKVVKDLSDCWIDSWEMVQTDFRYIRCEPSDIPRHGRARGPHIYKGYTSSFRLLSCWWLYSLLSTIAWRGKRGHSHAYLMPFYSKHLSKYNIMHLQLQGWYLS